ncbi:MAG: glycine betaine ABC transporter substrate-binding protein [Acidimicrobiia bacterium]
MRPRPLLVGLFLVLAGLPACGSDGDGDAGSGSTDSVSITVGSKLDTEAQLLAHLMAGVLEDRGYQVTRKIRLGSTDLIRRAVLAGDIDVYWEFTGTGLGILKQTPVGDPVQAYETAKRLDAANGVTWLPAAAMNDTYALAVADGGPVVAASLTALAEQVKAQPDTALCADPEGGFRADVLPAVQQSYGLEFRNIRQLGQPLIPPAVADGQCAVGIVYSTSALILKHKLAVLDDDKKAFGAYTPAPTVLTERLTRWPSLAEDLAGLTATLDTATMTGLNAQVEIDGKPAEAVADEFLGQRGLLQKG